MHCFRTLSLITLTCTVCAVGLPAVAQAQDADTPDRQPIEAGAEGSDELSYKELAKKGSEAFAAKDYAGAADAFERAYQLNPVPNLLYNIGRALEKEGKFKEANAAYTRFVTQPEVELRARQDALQRIETLRKVISLQESGEKIDAEAVDKEQGQHQLAETDVEGTAADEPEAAPEDGAQSIEEPGEVSQVDHTTAYIFGGVGAASLIGSGVFAYLSYNQTNKAADAKTLSERREANDTGQTYALVADSMLAGGVILAGVGLVLWLNPSDEAPLSESTEDDDLHADATRASFLPSIGTDHATLTFTLDF